MTVDGGAFLHHKARLADSWRVNICFLDLTAAALSPLHHMVISLPMDQSFNGCAPLFLKVTDLDVYQQ